MNPFEALEPGSPFPAVSADDMKRVWRMAQTVKRDVNDQTQEATAQNVGFDARLIAGQCEPGANIYAVFFRTALLRYFLDEGLLEEWREGDTLSDSVFQVGATFPMELGDRGFDPEAFISRLRAL